MPLKEITNLIIDFRELLYLLGYDPKSCSIEEVNYILEYMSRDIEIYNLINDDFVEQVNTVVYQTTVDLNSFKRKVQELNV